MPNIAILLLTILTAVVSATSRFTSAQPVAVVEQRAARAKFTISNFKAGNSFRNRTCLYNFDVSTSVDPRTTAGTTSCTAHKWLKLLAIPDIAPFTPCAGANILWSFKANGIVDGDPTRLGHLPTNYTLFVVDLQQRTGKSKTIDVSSFPVNTRESSSWVEYDGPAQFELDTDFPLPPGLGPK